MSTPSKPTENLAHPITPPNYNFGNNMYNIHEQAHVFPHTAETSQLQDSSGFPNNFNNLLQQGQPHSQQFDISHQMQHLHQMRMLQSLGQYGQLSGFSGFNVAYGGGAHNDQPMDSDKGSMKDIRSIGGGKLDGKKAKRKKSSNVKRPTTAYLYFVSKYREELKSAGDAMPKQAKEMMQECAAKWRSMTDEGKIPYHKLAGQDKERWLNEKAAEKKPKDQWRPKRPPSAYFLFLKDFRASWKTDRCTDTTGSSAEDENENMDPERAKELATRLGNDDNDGSAILKIDEGPETKSKLDNDKSKKPVNPQKEITKRAGERWNAMSDEQKAPYVANAQETRVKWEKQLQIYKNEIRNGKTGEEAAGRLNQLNQSGDLAINEAIADLPTKTVTLESPQELPKPEQSLIQLSSNDLHPTSPPAQLTTSPSQLTPPVYSPSIQNNSQTPPGAHNQTPDLPHPSMHQDLHMMQQYSMQGTEQMMNNQYHQPIQEDPHLMQQTHHTGQFEWTNQYQGHHSMR